jgi:gamma-glutamyl-gamma-aminobutyrate hydrolase PuuD
MNEVGCRTEHPLIGLNGFYTERDVPRVEVRLSYADAVIRAGGVPVVLPPVGARRELERLVGMLDGLVLSGGDDFDTERLGRGPTHPEALVTPAAKQDFDMLLAELALEAGLPTLGICYGMQALALTDPETTLFQHLPEDRPGAQDHRGRRRHPVRIDPATKLARTTGVERLDVISSHHQAIDRLGPRWRVSARDDEGLVEAIELAPREGGAGHPFAVGVQWHPEASPEGTPHDRIFRGLVGAAGMLAARRDFPTPAR